MINANPIIYYPTHTMKATLCNATYQFTKFRCSYTQTHIYVFSSNIFNKFHYIMINIKTM